jgi:Tol biopolymer transport system component
VAGHFDISTSGDLVYIKGVKSDPLYELEWLDREGGRRPVKGIGPANYGSFAISPNGKWFAYCVKFRGQSDIMIYDIERELSTNNLTSSTTNETDPVWSPDGSAIAYTMKSREKGAAVYWKALYSTGKPQLLTSDLSRHPAPLSWQGEKLITISDLELQIHTIKGNSQSGWSISTQSKDALTFGGWAAKLSTDGKWLAYASAILGDPQIYVRPTLSGAAPIRISREGGSKPVWSESSQELLFEVNINDDKARVFAVNYQMDGDQFKSDLDAVPWTSDGTFENHWLSTNFDLDPVRQRLLVRKSLEDQSATPIHQVVLIENFFTDLIDKLKLDHD